MAHKIVVLTGDSGGSAEDGNVYYASFLLVSSDTLAFDEPIFGDDVITADDFPELAGDDPDELASEKVADYLRTLGYVVEEPESKIITLQE